MIEINGKKHGPFEVSGASWKYVSFGKFKMAMGLEELEEMGAIVTEVKETLVFEFEFESGNGYPNSYHVFLNDNIHKRFKCKLEEIVE